MKTAPEVQWLPRRHRPQRPARFWHIHKKGVFNSGSKGHITGIYMYLLFFIIGIFGINPKVVIQLKKGYKFVFWYHGHSWLLVSVDNVYRIYIYSISVCVAKTRLVPRQSIQARAKHWTSLNIIEHHWTLIMVIWLLVSWSWYKKNMINPTTMVMKLHI